MLPAKHPNVEQVLKSKSSVNKCQHYLDNVMCKPRLGDKPWKLYYPGLKLELVLFMCVCEKGHGQSKGDD